jgi:hypothetical protein
MAGLAAWQIHDGATSDPEQRDALDQDPRKIGRDTGAHFPGEPELPVLAVATSTESKRASLGLNCPRRTPNDFILELVSRDAHLLWRGSYVGIQIMNGAEFLSRGGGH